MTREGHLRIGTSGWQYDHWRERFYPEGLRKARWFEHYASVFDTVEVNSTFYRMMKETVFDKWRKQAPEGFSYVLKYSRYGTHVKRLADPAEHVAPFVERARRLEEHLGAILVQLPPHWNVDTGRLGAFLDAAPADLRWALEFRDASWLCDRVYGLLRSRNAALCIHDIIRDHPRVLTADWVYLRFHGGGRRGDYTESELASTAAAVREYLSDGLDVYAYFNNDLNAYAVNNARCLRSLLEGT